MVDGRVRYRFTPRFYALIVIIICFALAIPVIANSITLSQQQAQISALQSERSELTYRSSILRRKAAFSDTDEFVIREARRLGMAFPGESVFMGSAEVR